MMEEGSIQDPLVCDTGKGRSKASIRKVTYGFHLVEGKQGKQGHAMENYHAAQFKEVDDCEVVLFVIFDGHSGNNVASYLRDHLFDNILNTFQFIGNVPRVDGLLAMSWAFGDSTLKEHISSDPDVAAEIIDSEAEFIILGSDGLRKGMSNQEAVDTIKHSEGADSGGCR